MRVFVFGSNLAGRHGKGAALHALHHHGAIYGQGVGLQGQSYGIPTKNRNLEVLPLESIKFHVDNFLEFAFHHPEMDFDLTPIGCGYAGYTQTAIKPLFKAKPYNVYFTKDWII